jgi:hypothetical protein
MPMRYAVEVVSPQAWTNRLQNSSEIKTLAQLLQALPLYLAEYDHRHNCRKMTDGERTDVGLTKAVGKRLIYKNRAL